MLIGAVVSYQYLPVDAVPDITNVQVQIITRAESLDGETIEANITYPIESAMGAVPDVHEVRSVTRYGLSVVTVIFEEGMDIYLARQLINEQLSTLDLQGYKPRLGPIATGLGEIYHYSLDYREPASDPQKRLEQLNRLRTIQEWDIKRRLLSIPGVAEVNTIGGYEEVYFVQPDPAKMARYGIHFDDIRQALEESNRNAGGAYIQQSANQLIVQGSGLIQSKEEIRSLTLKQLPDLTTLRIGDVANVGLDREIRTGAAVVNGSEAVLGTAFMLLGENSRTVASRVDEKIQQIKKNLPEDVVLKTVYNRSYLVDGTIETVRSNLTFGALLVVAVLLFLTGNVRAA
ncbi:MAG TPA: CusA/CzcA family heavy metal efflux RND transporter, partial [Leptospiraceae bacterium]|nr:CusA/CzcA family heavy metal efflux RND transporter [Leptospiraceae bacterium]